MEGPSWAPWLLSTCFVVIIPNRQPRKPSIGHDHYFLHYIGSLYNNKKHLSVYYYLEIYTVVCFNIKSVVFSSWTENKTVGSHDWPSYVRPPRGIWVGVLLMANQWIVYNHCRAIRRVIFFALYYLMTHLNGRAHGIYIGSTNTAAHTRGDDDTWQHILLYTCLPWYLPSGAIAPLRKYESSTRHQAYCILYR